jgi:hypothetical protein
MEPNRGGPVWSSAIILGCVSIFASIVPFVGLFLIYVTGANWSASVIALFVLSFSVGGALLSVIAASKGSRLWFVVAAMDVTFVLLVIYIISRLHSGKQSL